MLDWLKNKVARKHNWIIRDLPIKWYPSNKSCIKQNMSSVRPQQMPPLIVRKAPWRR